MKKSLLILNLLFIVVICKAQIAITPNQTALLLTNKIIATSGTLGVTISNAVLTCDSMANAEFSGSSNLGITDGILLSNGYTSSLAGNYSTMASEMLNAPGDSTIYNIVNLPTYDACVLEFDITPVGNVMQFEYVFGSEEYPNFNCTSFNDAFAFMISGPGFSTPTNIALVPGSSNPVSINTINDESNGGCGDSTYYVTNVDTTITLNGFTTPLIAQASVIPNSTYHLKLAIADVSDDALNSYVILKANSLKSSGTTSVKQYESNTYIKIIQNENNTLELINKNNLDFEISIYSIEGKKLVESNLLATENSKIVTTEHLPKGLYIIKCTNLKNKINYSQKFIQQ